MNRKNVVYILSGVAFAITFLLVFSSYFVADEQRMATIAIKDVPYNAIEDAAVKNQPIYWKGNVYEPEKLKSISVLDIGYFKVNPMDNVKFSVGYEYSYEHGVGRHYTTVFVRGVKYNDIPFVYDYEREIDLKPADVVPDIFGQYELKEFRVSKNPPWVIDIKYQKSGLLSNIFTSVGFGFLASLAIGLVTIMATTFAMIINIKKKIKQEKVK